MITGEDATRRFLVFVSARFDIFEIASRSRTSCHDNDLKKKRREDEDEEGGDESFKHTTEANIYWN